MKRVRPLIGLFFCSSLSGVSFPAHLQGQDPANPQEASGPQEPRALTLDDYGSWSTVGQVALSANGRWMTFSYSPNEGDSGLFLRDLDALGQDPVELSVNGSGPVFSG